LLIVNKKLILRLVF